MHALRRRSVGPRWVLLLLLGPCWSPTDASNGYTLVSMRADAAQTYYVEGRIEGYGAVDFMVDTGAGYTSINQNTLAALQAGSGVTYLRQQAGVLADGTRVTVPVYLIAGITLGGACRIPDVEVAVFPGSTRAILGMSALGKAAPFVFSISPPILELSNCARVRQGTDPD